MVNFSVYALCDDAGVCRYVGKSVDPDRRFRKHLWAAKSGHKGHKNAWIRSLLKRDVSPTLVILESVANEEECFELERFYISYFTYLGFDLTNETLGGEGLLGKKHSAETKEKMKRTPNAGRFKVGVSRPVTAEQIRKSALARVGRLVTSETRAKLQSAQPHKKQIHQYDDSGTLIATFPSTKSAAKAVGASLGNIQKAASLGQRAKGWYWQWN